MMVHAFSCQAVGFHGVRDIFREPLLEQDVETGDLSERSFMSPCEHDVGMFAESFQPGPATRSKRHTFLLAGLRAHSVAWSLACLLSRRTACVCSLARSLACLIACWFTCFFARLLACLFFSLALLRSLACLPSHHICHNLAKHTLTVCFDSPFLVLPDT